MYPRRPTTQLLALRAARSSVDKRHFRRAKFQTLPGITETLFIFGDALPNPLTVRVRFTSYRAVLVPLFRQVQYRRWFSDYRLSPPRC